jgi:hypothetical protein
MTLSSIVRRIRQNHALEHATLTLLGQRLGGLQAVARSDSMGFIVYGDVPTEALRAAAAEALIRLQNGEARLAVHPNCGTNLVTSAVLSAGMALIGGSGKRPWYDRLPGAVMGTLAALIVAAPIGRWLQQNLTTLPDVAELQLLSVTRSDDTPAIQHRVRTGV